MPGSPFYARIRSDVLAILRAVPPDMAVTYADIGAHLEVPARHVAYILAQIDDQGAAGVDPARAVRLADATGRTIVSVATLGHGVPQQQRPADAPMPRREPRR